VIHRPPGDVVVRAPVRIADAAAAGLLRPGDRVDVLAASRVIATAVTVAAVPDAQQAPQAPEEVDAASAAAMGHEGTAPGGVLVILSVPRRVAAALSGAAATSPLAVALC
jgi:hypothetical protein